ncbi:Vacuolar cation/proton exchanger 5 (Ca(2+)/H(+) antiporter CAX5) (Ca(2+)/H(+) exchanger 5) (Protein CATION EXCHANGER 5) [Durusdinium trenchii]|uniref:Vacuolar cation/proton exchanger 5 (Ca(2+)/H(+) antiporter CAX5) (Ca(2+)/H(+) exchanger 5) (Protein CATION EXCHANGER 5) n=1 Tax=Durusdinium trenchii TaxID=1381693 RepID=A0ABP0I0I1_9DINO
MSIAHYINPESASFSELYKNRRGCRYTRGYSVPLEELSDHLDRGLIKRRSSKEAPNWDGLQEIFWSPFSLLLVFVPLGFLSATHEWGDGWIFILNFIALLPLAKLLGDATEELAVAIKNDAVAGMLNATFGNIVEMMITLNTLRSKKMPVPERTNVVKSTLLGSILSNLLLVLGMSFCFGGLTQVKVQAATAMVGGEKEQKFAMKGVTMQMGLLVFCCMSFALPTLFAQGYEDDRQDLLDVSRWGGLLLGSAYLAFLFFQLVSHKKTLENEEGELKDQENEDEEDRPPLAIWVSLTMMIVITGITDLISDYLCESINGVTENINVDFLGTILLPIAGNACEHLGAVRFAMDDKPGLAVGIAIGSSTQVALFVVPFAVIVGWMWDVPMTLDFGPVNTAVIFFSVLLATVLMSDGRSHWLKGYLLMLAYVFIAVLFWNLPPKMD